VHVVPVEVFEEMILIQHVKMMQAAIAVATEPLRFIGFAARRQLKREPLRIFTCDSKSKYKSQVRVKIGLADGHTYDILHVLTWCLVIDDVCEGRVEVDYKDVAVIAQLLLQHAVVSGRDKVAVAFATCVVIHPGVPRHATERVHIVNKNLLRPELLQAVHVGDDLVRHVLDVRGQWDDLRASKKVDHQ
jgi:hypothetical protein